MWRNDKDSSVGTLYEYFKMHTTEIASELAMSEEECEDLYDFAENFEYYSDWYKELHGFRPRRDDIEREQARYNAGIDELKNKAASLKVDIESSGDDFADDVEDEYEA